MTKQLRNKGLRAMLVGAVTANAAPRLCRGQLRSDFFDDGDLNDSTLTDGSGK